MQKKLKHCIFLLLYLVGNISVCFGQQDREQCGSRVPDLDWEMEFQELIKHQKSQKEVLSGPFTIPVIFHILHAGQSTGAFPNLAAAQILSQITVLNQDFAGAGTFVSKYPSDAFKVWAINQSLPAANLDSKGRVKIADFNIKFCAAVKDEQGKTLAEPGIDRIDITAKGWTNPASITDIYKFIDYFDTLVKPASIWDPSKYLNIWVSDKHSAILFAGYASMPPLSTLAGSSAIGTDTTDGVWCSASALGSYLIYPGGTYVSSGVIGQVTTHEVGHWLGLRHIWGDATCGTDYCNDTPPAIDANTASPVYPHNVGGCTSPSNSPDGEMFMNFMDYTYGDGKYMFTTDQATRAQTAMLNSPFRKFLGTHSLCEPTTVKEYNSSRIEPFIYPNPSNDKVNIQLNGQKLVSVSIYNSTGMQFRNNLSDSFSIKDLADGFYFILIKTEQGIYCRKILKQ